MEKYINNVTSATGDVIVGAQILVTTLSGTNAVIYATDGGAAVTNPLISGVNGYFEFYANDGQYKLTVSGPGIKTFVIADIRLSDSLPLLTEIKSRVYGPLAADPTVDPIGNAPTFGDEYYNTVLLVLKRFNGTTWLADISPANLSANGGSALVGNIVSGTGSVLRTLASKVNDIISVRDKGAVVNGTTDDTLAIRAARGVVEGKGGTVVYGGKSAATGFWENLSALAMEWVKGSATAYAIDLESSKPIISLKLFNGTPSAGPGYAAYGARFDGYTKPGVDAASSVAGLFAMQSYSTNSSGTNFNNTNQVALVANSSALDSASSASIEAFNAIAFSAYTGTLPQQVIGIESDIGASRSPGWLGDASKNFGVAYSAIVAGGTQDITVAYACDTSEATQSFWHGAVYAGVSKTGLTVARNGAIVPESGVWVSAASTFGIYVGAKNKHQLNPGSIANFTYKPVVGLGLGQEGATSANSHKLRFISTNAASAEVSADIYTDSDGNLSFDVAGVNKVRIAAFNGSVFVSGQQVLSTRNTGWGDNTGATSKLAFDPATVTLQTLAQTVSALQQALKNHGLIGA